MHTEAVAQAQERLHRAKTAYAILASEADKKERESAWIDILHLLGTFYSKLEQGAKRNAKSWSWFVGKKAERKSDPLLQYIQHARNVAEHSIMPSSGYAEIAVSTSDMQPGDSFGLKQTPEGFVPITPGQARSCKPCVMTLLYAALLTAERSIILRLRT